MATNAPNPTRLSERLGLVKPSATLAVTAATALLRQQGKDVIDFGTGGASILNASNFTIDAGATLTINGWNDMVDYFFAQHWTGATLPSRGLGPETQVTFTGFTPSQTAWLPYDSTHDQITPAPEPATYGAMLMGAALAFLGFRSYRRKSAAGT